MNCAWPPARCGATTIRRATGWPPRRRGRGATMCRHRSMPGGDAGGGEQVALVDEEDVGLDGHRRVAARPARPRGASASSQRRPSSSPAGAEHEGARCRSRPSVRRAAPPAARRDHRGIGDVLVSDAGDDDRVRARGRVERRAAATTSNAPAARRRRPADPDVVAAADRRRRGRRSRGRTRRPRERRGRRLSASLRTMAFLPLARNRPRARRCRPCESRSRLRRLRRGRRHRPVRGPRQRRYAHLEDLEVELVGAHGPGEVVAGHGAARALRRGPERRAPTSCSSPAAAGSAAAASATQYEDGTLAERLRELHDGGADDGVRLHRRASCSPRPASSTAGRRRRTAPRSTTWREHGRRRRPRGARRRRRRRAHLRRRHVRLRPRLPPRRALVGRRAGRQHRDADGVRASARTRRRVHRHELKQLAGRGRACR